MANTNPPIDPTKSAAEPAEGGQRIALVLGGGAPTLTLQAGALLALHKKGVKFDVISTSGAGMLVGLLYAASKGGDREKALRETVNLGVHDAIYDWFPINYKVFCKPGPLAALYRQWTMPFVHALPDATDAQRLYKDWVHLWVAAMSPTSMTPRSLGMCEAAPWLEDVVDFGAVKKLETEFFINAWNIREKKMRVFNQDQITAAHFRAALAFPLIYPPFELDGDFYIEGSAMETLNLTSLLRYDHLFDREYLKALVDDLDNVLPQIAQLDKESAKRLIEKAKTRSRHEAMRIIKELTKSGEKRKETENASTFDLEDDEDRRKALHRLRQNTLCAAALKESKAETKQRIGVIDRIVAFDVLGTDALIRRPRSLYDAWVLQMIVPLVSLANMEIAEFREDFESNIKSEDDRILHLLHFEKHISHDHWDRVLDWSYSNLRLLFDAGYRAGEEFYEEKKAWLGKPEKAPAPAGP